MQVRAALTQTRNAYPDMPASVDELPALHGRLDDLRRANLDHHRTLIEAAQRHGVQVLCLGELFAAPYFALTELPMWRDLAEDAEHGPTVTMVRGAAREHRMVILAPIYELDAATGRRFNTAVVVDRDGAILGRYRKNHIPHGRNEQGAFAETFYYQPGDGPGERGNPFFPVFPTAHGVLGVSICYDRHFEGVVRSLVAGGAQIVFCPAVTFGAQSARLWELEFAVDAARHRVFIGGANRAGREPPWNQEFFGNGHFCGPDGRLEERSEHPELVIADLDLAQLTAPTASGWQLRRDARPAIYDPR